jgi:very-short-patch-repair endonuclease
LRDRQLGGYKFVEQFPIGDHVADLACRRAKLVVELDGGQHRAELDAERTRAIEAAGFRVIRFWNHDVLGNADGVLETILSELRLGGGE